MRETWDKYFRINGGETHIRIPGRVQVMWVDRSGGASPHHIDYRDWDTYVVFNYPFKPGEEIEIRYETNPNGLQRAITKTNRI